MIDKKLMLIGWDAADWKVIRPLMEAGGMPHLRNLIESGTSGNLTTLSPVLSPMLWTSIATGKRPFKHGIYGFIEPTINRDGVQPITNLSRKTKAIWNILGQNDLKCNVVGWWPSHPAEPINGVMVSNQYQRAPKSRMGDWPMLPETVHPPGMTEELAELRFHPAELDAREMLDFVPNASTIDQKKDRRLDALARIIADATSIHCAATHLVDTQQWDFMAVYFDAIDHFSHGFMRFHPPQLDGVSDEDFDMFKHVVSAGYMYHDMMLGRMLELIENDVTVMVISDHGFHPGDLRPKNLPAEPAGPAIEHRDLGIFVMRGPNIKSNHTIGGATLLDVTPTILAHFGLPTGADMDGQVLQDVFQESLTPNSIPSWDEVVGDDGSHPPDKAVTAATSKEALKQLADLGYIEDPGDNVEDAVISAERELKYNLALSYMDAGMHGSAAELLVELYRKFPLEFRFGLRLALCLQTTGQIAQMSEIVEHMDATWRVAAGKAKQRIRDFLRKVSERVEEGKAEGSTDLTQRDLISEMENTTLRQLRAIARGNPETIEYLFASIAVALEDPETALARLENARQSANASPNFHLQVGNAYLALGRYGNAEESYRRVIELEPENPNAPMGLARIAVEREDARNAIEYAQASLALKYHNPAGHYFLGEAFLLDGKSDDALAAMNTAIELNPNFLEAHERLAELYRSRGAEMTRAKQHLQAASAIKQLQADRKKPVALQLPKLEPVDIEGELPQFKNSPENRMHLPLASYPHPQEVVDGPPAIIVSGLPRSGTSMAMQMLAAGGVPILTDEDRVPDDNNPLGYLEYDLAKSLNTCNDWLNDARGKALKIVAPLVPYLPQAMEYRVILMDRSVEEIAASQRKMLERLESTGGDFDDEQIIKVLTEQFQIASKILDAHKIRKLDLKHSDVLSDPKMAAEKIAQFLNIDLDTQAMAAVVDPSLWRVRAG